MMTYISNQIKFFKLYLLAKEVNNKITKFSKYKLEQYNNSHNPQLLRNIESNEYNKDYYRFSTTDNLRFTFSNYYVQVMFMNYPVGNQELVCFSFIKFYSYFQSKIYDVKYIPIIKEELIKISKFMDDVKEYHTKLENENAKTLSETIHKTLLGE